MGTAQHYLTLRGKNYTEYRYVIIIGRIICRSCSMSSSNDPITVFPLVIVILCIPDVFSDWNVIWSPIVTNNESHYVHCKSWGFICGT